MMQQRLKAKLMVARWGREEVPGAGWVSNVSKAPWKREKKAEPSLAGLLGRETAGRTLQSWGEHSVGLARTGNEIFVFSFSLESAEKSIFMTRVTSGLASHGSQSFPPEHTQGHKQGCIFVPPVLRFGLSCCPHTGSILSVSFSRFVLNQITESLCRPRTSSVLHFLMCLASDSPRHSETLLQIC